MSAYMDLSVLKSKANIGLLLKIELVTVLMLCLNIDSGFNPLQRALLI